MVYAAIAFDILRPAIPYSSCPDREPGKSVRPDPEADRIDGEDTGST